MSEFLYHASCDECGSSDAKAVYEDGSSWCFSCHSYKRGNRFINESKQKKTKALPSDANHEYGSEAVEWVSKYGLTVQDLIRNKVSYSKYRGLLIFSWEDEEGRVLGWQGRSFREGTPKYLNSGNLEEVLPIYCNGESLYRHCFLVEDCLSAIKVAKSTQEAAMPCLTSSLSTTKLNRLARLFNAFTVWLDHDMFHNAQKMVRQLQLMGCEAKAVWTPLDPKCYKPEEICNVVLTGKPS